MLYNYGFYDIFFKTMRLVGIIEIHRIKYTFFQLISDLLITLPIVDEIQQKVAGGWPIYLYIFNYVNKAGFPANFPLIGCLHWIVNY